MKEKKLKNRTANVIAGTSSTEVESDKCVIPPRPAMHVLKSYTLTNVANEKEISDYVEWQARGETVEHAEKVKTENFLSGGCPFIYPSRRLSLHLRQPQSIADSQLPLIAH